MTSSIGFGSCARTWLLGGVVLGAVLLAASCDLGSQQAFVVTTVVDGVDADPGDGFCEMTAGADDCSLRAAVQEANAFDGRTTITLGAGETYQLSVAGTEDLDASAGDLDVASSVVVDGGGATVDAGGGDRAFQVRAGGTLVVNELTITGGVAEYGGGVASDGTLEVVDSTVVDNESTGRFVCGWLGCFGKGGGAGIESTGVLRVRGSTITANRATGDAGCTTIIRTSCAWYEGAGVLVSSGSAGLVGVTISGNESAEGFGAGLAANGAPRCSS